MREEEIIRIIKEGGVGVFPTDTLYGLVGSAFNEEAVERIYTTKHRDPQKPLIILIGDVLDVARFDIELSEEIRKRLDEIWPAPVSVLFPCFDEKFAYLHRGTNEIAFRFPQPEDLRKILAQTGPLVAPSANPEGLEPASNIEEAKKYFGDKVDFYYDGGILQGEPSTLIRFEGKEIIVLRKGAVTFS